MLVPFLTVLPGMLAAVLVPEIARMKAGEKVTGGASGSFVQYNDSVLFLIRNLLPTGLTGVAITGLLAAFMAGMAANISAFNTVFSVDIWQHYVIKDKPDGYYVKVGTHCHSHRDRRRHWNGVLWRPGSPTSWTTCRRCSDSSTLRCLQRLSSACSGSAQPRMQAGRAWSSAR